MSVEALPFGHFPYQSAAGVQICNHARRRSKSEPNNAILEFHCARAAPKCSTKSWKRCGTTQGAGENTHEEEIRKGCQCSPQTRNTMKASGLPVPICSRAYSNCDVDCSLEQNELPCGLSLPPIRAQSLPDINRTHLFRQQLSLSSRQPVRLPFSIL